MSLNAALLRGVNVGGRNKVSMTDLRACLERRGFTRVRTLLQSGNVVLDAGRQAGAPLERKLESEFEGELGLKVQVFTREHEELASLIADNPFAEFAALEPNHMVAVFLKRALEPAEAEALCAPHDGPERAHIAGRHMYITYPAGIGESRFKPPAQGTARNWSTVLKLAAMLGAQ